ncbi:MAG: hypothetical protein KKB34_02275 [Bacteroidetes bacterium]|nr:hypothetical protein [Bacteroidota bacterium]
MTPKTNIGKCCVLISILSLLTTFLLVISCDDTTNGPEEPPPGFRDYIWTIDTLDTYAPFYRMWGSSPSDVWAINSGDADETIFHYDGNEWSTDGKSRRVRPHSIWGFSDENVWIGGSDGAIWHYSVYFWSENVVFRKDGNRQIVFDNMWGDAPNNLYAFGGYADDRGAYNNSVIAHYSGNEWAMLNTDGLTGIVERYYKNKSDGKRYLQTYRLGGGEYNDSTLIYEHNQNEYKKIYGNIWTKGLQTDLSLINGEVYFVMGSRIAKRVNNQFRTIITVDNPEFYQRIWGRSMNDIFLLMTDGLVHYNGNDMEYLFQFSNPNTKPWTQIYGAAIFEKEIFFTVYEPPTDLKLIYHGKIN